MSSYLRFCSLVVVCLLAGCGTDGAFVSPVGTTSSVNPETGELHGQPSFRVTPNTEVGAETFGVAAVGSVLGAHVSALGLPGTGTVFGPGNTALLYIIYDPLAPNWTIKEKALNADTYYLSLRAKSFRTGGDGEAIQVVKRRALQLQREKGYASYRILDYSEGIESSTPLTHRVSEGTIQLVELLVPKKR